MIENKEYSNMKHSGEIDSILDNKKEFVANKIKSLRESTGLSREKFADEIGISKDTLYNYESMKNPVNIESLIKYSIYFNVSLDYILGNIDEKTHDNKFICEEFGFTELSVEKLKEFCHDFGFADHGEYIRNYIFESDDFWHILKRVSSHITTCFKEKSYLINKFPSEAEDPLYEFVKRQELNIKLSGNEYKISNLFNSFLASITATNHEAVISKMYDLEAEAEEKERMLKENYVKDFGQEEYERMIKRLKNGKR